MSKEHFIKCRLSAEDAREIDRICAAVGVSRSEYLRSVALIGPRRDTEKSGDSENIAPRLDEIESALDKSAAAFDALLSRLGEIMRIPSFREYRTRRLIDEPHPRQGEKTGDYLIRIAGDYCGLYGQWPDPKDNARFGSLPEGVYFPKDRPQ
ncbi:MAG: hypothetical protein EPN34_14740 [Burkholderiaceae bacterium]|nr:MAG: hypothetical protein EPN34_14740 [Burkholderiaceae bacterium]